MPKERETKEVIARLRREGWSEKTGKGSHKVFRKDGRTVSVPTSKKEISLGTFKQIARIAGWKVGH